MSHPLRHLAGNSTQSLRRNYSARDSLFIEPLQWEGLHPLLAPSRCVAKRCSVAKREGGPVSDPLVHSGAIAAVFGVPFLPMQHCNALCNSPGLFRIPRSRTCDFTPSRLSIRLPSISAVHAREFSVTAVMRPHRGHWTNRVVLRPI